MKIATLSKIKNEADIIESFVRYHGKIVDSMFFVENGSTDGTLKILQKLRQEGYPITIFDERDREFDELKFINKYAEIILKREEVDWLVPIDADEFIYREGENPRTYMEDWKLDTVYMVNWRTYIWGEERAALNEFVPDKFEIYRNEKYEKYTKVIVPGKLYQEKGLMIGRGNHNVVGIDVKAEREKNIKFAHYPVRGEEQFKTQVAINNIMQLSRCNHQKGEAWHWSDMYQMIKEQERIDLKKVSLAYAVPQEEWEIYGEIETCRGKIEHGFLGNMRLKYGKYARVSAFYNLMCASEKLAEKFSGRSGGVLDGGQNLVRKRIAIYGTGRMAQDYAGAINSDLYEVVAFIDSNAVHKEVFCGKKVQSMEVLYREGIDLIVIASSAYFHEIKSGLLDRGFAEEKICFISEVVKCGWGEEYHVL